MSDSGPHFDAALAQLLEELGEKVVAYLKRERDRHRLDLSGAQASSIATIARAVAHDHVTEAYRRGRDHGRAQVRAELALPAEAPLGPDDPTRELSPCPLRPSHLCTIPAAVRRKDPAT